MMIRHAEMTAMEAKERKQLDSIFGFPEFRKAGGDGSGSAGGVGYGHVVHPFAGKLHGIPGRGQGGEGGRTALSLGGSRNSPGIEGQLMGNIEAAGLFCILIELFEAEIG